MRGYKFKNSYYVNCDKLEAAKEKLKKINVSDKIIVKTKDAEYIGEVIFASESMVTIRGDNIPSESFGIPDLVDGTVIDMVLCDLCTV